MSLQKGRRPPRQGKTASFAKVKKNSKKKYSGKQALKRAKQADQSRRKQAEPQKKCASAAQRRSSHAAAREVPLPHRQSWGLLVRGNGNVEFRCTEQACRKSRNVMNYAAWLPRGPAPLTPCQLLPVDFHRGEHLALSLQLGLRTVFFPFFLFWRL